MGNQSSSTLFFAIVVTYSALALHLISKAQQISLIWPSFDTKKNDFLCPGAATDVECFNFFQHLKSLCSAVTSCCIMYVH